ncbi:MULTISPECIES: hypothetical protein [unclassified Sphingobium]|nr:MULTISPECIES: hypothetical protein [unclassified Sphingobium]
MTIGAVIAMSAEGYSGRRAMPVPFQQSIKRRIRFSKLNRPQE